MIEVILDPGHGGHDVGASGINGIKEKECTLYVCKACEAILKKHNISVKLTRRDDMYLTDNERNKIAKSLSSKCFISVHFNSSNDLMKEGTEIFFLKSSEEGRRISEHIKYSLSKETNLPSIGINNEKYREIEGLSNAATLVKVCFLSNPKEENLLKDYNFKEKIAQGLANGILEYLGKGQVLNINSNAISEGYEMSDIKTNIINEPLESKNQAKQWAKDRGATKTFIGLADLYWKLYKECGGVNPVMAYAQAALETGYGKFGGVVKESFKNPCGLKTAVATEDSSEAHAKFSTWKEGIYAHLDHLALYAGAIGYPKTNTTDPKHFQYLFGVCKYVEDLSGLWAPGDEYSLKVLTLMDSISETTVVDEFDDNYIENEIDKPEDIINVEEKVESLNDMLVKLKEEYLTLFKIIDEGNKVLEKLKEENNDLREENKEYREKLLEYKKIIESIYTLVDIK